jgi:ATP/maltotriose-dependent transcriptional regulator MalT
MVRGRLAKLVMPVSAHVLSRSRLFEQMDQACHHPLVWIGAAAGADKSTLAASYVQACGRPALWYRLDEGDKDPATLFGEFRGLFTYFRNCLRIDAIEIEKQENFQG